MTSIISPDSVPITFDKVQEYRQQLQSLVLKRDKYSVRDCADVYERYAIALFYHGSYRESISYFTTASALRASKRTQRSDAYASVLVSVVSASVGVPSSSADSWVLPITASTNFLRLRRNFNKQLSFARLSRRLPASQPSRSVTWLLFVCYKSATGPRLPPCQHIVMSYASMQRSDRVRQRRRCVCRVCPSR